MRVLTDDYDILARIALLDAVDDCFRLTTTVRYLDSKSKGKWGMWFSSTTALYAETVRLDLVPVHKPPGSPNDREGNTLERKSVG